MKWMIASDLHGSAYWCEKLVEAFRREGADRLILLGDLLYHGPRNPLPEGHNPQKCVEVLDALRDKTVAVRGNCDAAIDQVLLPFPWPLSPTATSGVRTIRLPWPRAAC